MQIPILITDNEEQQDLVFDINNRLDQIAREFNRLAAIESDDTSEVQGDVDISSNTVYEPLLGRYYRFGLLLAANAPNRCLFEDSADGKLKYKDGSGTITVLT